jgi:hypothetical protein
MTMRALAVSRRDRPDLLTRPPCSAAICDGRWAALIVDSTEQLKTLADLLARGLLSPEEYQQHKAKVLDQ